MATTYRMKIVREGYEFEVEGDRKFVLEMLKRFSPQASAELASIVEKRQEPKKKPSVEKMAVGTKTLSIREFIQRLGLTKHTDITVAFGYYLEKHSGISEFTPADINNCYYDAKLESSNTSQMIIHNIKRGYLMPSKKKATKGKKLYTLTSTGEEFVKSRLAANS